MATNTPYDTQCSDERVEVTVTEAIAAFMVGMPDKTDFQFLFSILCASSIPEVKSGAMAFVLICRKSISGSIAGG